MVWSGLVLFLYITISYHFCRPSSVFFSPVSGVGAVAALPAGAALLLCSIVVASTIDWGQGNTAFTAQEWVFALKGGYFDTMMSHFIRNGGM
jgi:hypothetical protein